MRKRGEVYIKSAVTIMSDLFENHNGSCYKKEGFNRSWFFLSYGSACNARVKRTKAWDNIIVWEL